MTTVGYGDLSPCTCLGRFIACVTCIWGSFLMALCVVTVNNVFDLTHNQQMALRHIRLTRRAAISISRSIKYFLAKKRYFILKHQLDPISVEKSMFASMLQATSNE
jgi:hypothetical protein